MWPHLKYTYSAFKLALPTVSKAWIEETSIVSTELSDVVREWYHLS